MSRYRRYRSTEGEFRSGLMVDGLAPWEIYNKGAGI